MNKNNNINSISLSLFVISLIGAPFWGIISSRLFNIANTSLIITMPIGFILGLIIVKIILNYFDKKNIKPNKFNIILNIIIELISLFIYILISYRLAEFLSTQYLINTSSNYFYILILSITFYIANKGIETSSRVSTISIFIAILIFLFDFISLIKYVKIDNFLPLFTINKIDFIKSILLFSLIYVFSIFSLFGTNKEIIMDKEKYNKYHYIMSIISFLIIYGSTIVTLGIYGINLVNLFDYPLYTVLKKISLFSFIDSIENISVMLWMIFTINASSIILINIFNNQKEILKIKDKNIKYSKIIFFLLSFFIPYFFLTNNNYIETFEYTKIPNTLIIILLSIIILSNIIFKIKSRNKST